MNLPSVSGFDFVFFSSRYYRVAEDRLCPGLSKKSSLSDGFRVKNAANYEIKQ